jgi:hypothetical protein
MPRYPAHCRSAGDAETGWVTANGSFRAHEPILHELRCQLARLNFDQPAFDSDCPLAGGSGETPFPVSLSVGRLGCTFNDGAMMIGITKHATPGVALQDGLSATAKHAFLQVEGHPPLAPHADAPKLSPAAIAVR